MAIDDVFPVIAEPTRRRILDALRPGDRSVGELVDTLGVSQPTVSKHLKVLREAGLVTTRADGQRRFYAVDPGVFQDAAAWLTSFVPVADAAADVVPAVPFAAPRARPGTARVPMVASAPGVHAELATVPAMPGQPGQQLGRTVGRTVEQVTGRAQDLLDRLPKPKFGRRR